ncbi:MAG: hypothetical protein C0402_06870 [Thermodesulfovibrio sp.]|nr:hypothetical protein [Thermodesulfovibrio sp.]
MKKTFQEIIFILMLSLFISLMYTTASPTGMVLLKKAFRIYVPDSPAAEKSDQAADVPGDRK